MCACSQRSLAPEGDRRAHALHMWFTRVRSLGSFVCLPLSAPGSNPRLSGIGIEIGGATKVHKPQFQQPTCLTRKRPALGQTGNGRDTKV